ncbi:MAG: ParB N-terminal domain-containing protein [bacterium]
MNSHILPLTSRFIELAKFNPQHRPYVIRYPFNQHHEGGTTGHLEELASSIRHYGLLSPVIVQEGGGDDEVFIVHGARRFHACQSLGWSALPCQVVPSGMSAQEVYRLSLSVFLSHHKPNIIEQARIIQRLQAFFPQDMVIQDFLPRLGLLPQRKVLERVVQLAELEDEIAQDVAVGKADPQLGWRLVKVAPAARLALYRFLRRLPFTLSQQFEILEYVQEIALRDHTPLESLLTLQPVLDILASDLDQRQKANSIRFFWRARRYPRLTAIEEEFSREKKLLRLPEQLELYPPHNFEHGSYKFELKFSDLAEFRQKLDFLNQLVTNGKFNNIIKS